MSPRRLAVPILALALSFNVAAGQQSGTILLDPGHGGIDAGSWADGQPPEKWISLRASYTVAEAFTRRGLDVRLTRNGDETRTLAERAALRGRWML